jgi:hypothetical protein
LILTNVVSAPDIISGKVLHTFLNISFRDVRFIMLKTSYCSRHSHYMDIN